MTLNILLVDEDILTSRGKGVIEKDLGYHVDCVKDTEQARQLMNNNDYKALMIEPFVKEVPLNFHAPNAELIREARERNIPVIISSTQLPTFLFEFFGLVYGRDYQMFFEKPYFFEEIVPGLQKIVEGK